MSGTNRLDHPGTERPLHQCPFPDVHRRLEDAHYLWHEAQSSYFSPPRFRVHLNALIQNLRTITWLLQNNKASIPDFDSWYSEWQDRMRSDQVMRWLVKARNKVEKQGDLEKNSVLRISIVVAYTGQIYYDFVEKPSLKTIDLLRKIDLSRIPEDLLKDGLLKMERRWITRGLPGREILDALAYAYGFLADIVDDAHAQVGLPIPTLVSPAPDGSYSPFRGSTIYFQGRLPCMVSSDGYGEHWIELNSGALYKLRSTPKILKLSKRKARRLQLRYGTSVLESDGDLDTLEKWAQYFWRIACHMFERDGGHIHIAFLFHDVKLLQMRQMKSPTRGALFQIYGDLANEVARAGASEVIVINEVWTAPFDPAHPFRRAELSPERGEGLALFAVAADGSNMHFFAPITRTKGKAKLGPTERQKGLHPSLAPVVAAWRHP